MTERTDVIGELITTSIYALYDDAYIGNTFIVKKEESAIENEIVSYIKDSHNEINESEIREKMSLYFFMTSAGDSETLCRIL